VTSGRRGGQLTEVDVMPGARRLLLGMLATSIAAFSTLAEEVAGGEPIVRVDKVVTAWLHAHANGFATDVLSVVTQLGGARVLVPLTLVAVLVLVLRRRVAHAVLMGAALVGGEALNMGLKAAFERPRPHFSDPLATAGGFSFPSGHAMVSLTVYGALAFVIATSVKSRRARVLVFVSALGLVLAIGLSRVYLGVHYPSDVLAGYSAGLAWLMLCALGLLAASRTELARTRQPQSQLPLPRPAG
jgi:membrane-associated phospholipid phosphatase